MAELFIQDHKSNSSADVVARDAGIILSFALQNGADLLAIARALSRDPRGTPTGIMGVVIDHLAEDEGARVSGGAQITIVIAGAAVAKGRPRVTRRGFVYSPAKTRRYEAHGRLAAQEAMVDRAPIAVPVRAEISVDLPVPASWSAKRQDAALRGEIRPTSRPDTDNYIKAALDAVNAIVVTDDSLVVELAAEKKYARVPQLTITITITPLSAAAANGRAPR